MDYLHPIRLEASLHETVWGGRRLERDVWKQLPPERRIGEAWETEINTIAQNDPYTGKTLEKLVEKLGEDLLGRQAIAIFGDRFPLLAKFIDANAKLSVQVHPDDAYAFKNEGGKLGKTEFWYILAAEPGATIVYGFKESTSKEHVRQAIHSVTLESLLREEEVYAGDVIFVPAGTVHAIGSGVLLYELQEYSDITYRMYDYGRLTASGTPRDLHIERSLEVSHYTVSPHIKVAPVPLPSDTKYTARCLVACPYFVTSEIILQSHGYMKSKTQESCVILTSLSAKVKIRHGNSLEQSEPLHMGQTMVLPAALGSYCLEGTGKLLLSYVPSPEDEALRLWQQENKVM